MSKLSLTQGQVLHVANVVSNAVNEPALFVLVYNWPYEGNFVEGPYASNTLEEVLKVYRETKQKKQTNTYWIEIRVGIEFRILYPLEDYGDEESTIISHFTCTS